MSVVTREVLMGEGNGVASVIIMLTFTVRPGPHADTALGCGWLAGLAKAVVGLF